MDYKLILTLAVAGFIAYYFSGTNPDNGGLLPLNWDWNNYAIAFQKPAQCINPNYSSGPPPTYFCPEGGWVLWTYTNTFANGDVGKTWTFCCPVNNMPPPFNIINPPPQSNFLSTNGILNGVS